MPSPVSRDSESRLPPEDASRRPAGPGLGSEANEGDTAERTPCGNGGADWLMGPLEVRLLRHLLRVLGDPPIRIVLWGGSEISTSAAPPLARIFVRDRPTLWKLIINPDLHFGDVYAAGRIEVEGDLLELLDAIYRARQAVGESASRLWGAFVRWLRRLRANTITRSRANIHQHYDIGDDFYRLWLDDEMVYSCAYFPAPEVPLQQAQAAKMDYVCRKLGLRAGDSVVDVGSGWGALPLYMAMHYGAEVKAFNISHAQIVYARRRAKAEGLHHQVEFIEDDYRNMSGQVPSRKFDAFVSLGMLEHVGRNHYREFGRIINGCVGPSGRGLMQSIGQDQSSDPNPWIERRIFPGGCFPSFREMMDLWEPWGFSVLDVENLRLHYAKTLQHWLRRFESSADAVRRMFDQHFVRTWRLYLTGSIAAFNTGALQLFQVVFARPGVKHGPWTRAGLYCGSPSENRSRQGLPAR